MNTYRHPIILYTKRNPGLLKSFTAKQKSTLGKSTACLRFCIPAAQVPGESLLSSQKKTLCSLQTFFYKMKKTLGAFKKPARSFRRGQSTFIQQESARCIKNSWFHDLTGNIPCNENPSRNSSAPWPFSCLQNRRLTTHSLRASCILPFEEVRSWILHLFIKSFAETSP